MDPVPPDDREPRTDEDLAQALARARRHARNALSEALECSRALMDALSVATSGTGAGTHPLFAQLDAWIAGASQALGDDPPLGDDLSGALAGALEAEIARWEQRAREDDDARAVLRAFLGLREVLWELGVRPAPPAASGDPHRSPSPEPRTRPRVERVRVAGVSSES